MAGRATCQFTDLRPALLLLLLCSLRFALIRNFAGWEGFDGWARNAMFKILGEDKVMVEKLTPERLQAEFSLGPDAPQVCRDYALLGIVRLGLQVGCWRQSQHLSRQQQQRETPDWTGATQTSTACKWTTQCLLASSACLCCPLSKTTSCVLASMAARRARAWDQPATPYVLSTAHWAKRKSN